MSSFSKIKPSSPTVILELRYTSKMFSVISSEGISCCCYCSVKCDPPPLMPGHKSTLKVMSPLWTISKGKFQSFMFGYNLFLPTISYSFAFTIASRRFILGIRGCTFPSETFIFSLLFAFADMFCVELLPGPLNSLLLMFLLLDLTHLSGFCLGSCMSSCSMSCSFSCRVRCFRLFLKCRCFPVLFLCSPWTVYR